MVILPSYPQLFSKAVDKIVRCVLKCKSCSIMLALSPKRVIIKLSNAKGAKQKRKRASKKKEISHGRIDLKEIKAQYTTKIYNFEGEIK
jgi:hypothetical protein